MLVANQDGYGIVLSPSPVVQRAGRGGGGGGAVDGGLGLTLPEWGFTALTSLGSRLDS